jgi:hypothetical protein
LVETARKNLVPVLLKDNYTRNAIPMAFKAFKLATHLELLGIPSPEGFIL